MGRQDIVPNTDKSNKPPPDTLHDSESTWCLVGTIDQTTGQRTIFINATPFRIGRCTELSLSIPNRTVSGVHAQIDVRDGWLTVRDLDSTNGTFVNGSRAFGEVTLSENDVIQFADIALRLQRETNASDARHTAVTDASDRAAALIHFDQLLDGESAVAFFQPIVRLDTQCTVGYEVLARSRLFGLKTPQEMFAVAAQLGLEGELSRCCRQKGVSLGAPIRNGANLFLNTHPAELREPGLVASLRELRCLAGDRPLTLEIHEAAVTNVDSIRELRTTLCDLNIQLAYDDFGAGQGRLLELVEVPPDFLKFDLQLIQGIYAAAAQRQQMLATLVGMVTDLGVTSIAEGIETEADGVACRQLGFALAQGYLFGRPGPVRTFVGEP
jgi:EAL domain-containing protein (putative c-di-GMP-specific phosphodiesterase class I)